MAATMNPTKHLITKTYRELKEKHPGAILLFRMGDFYEVYSEDAEKASKILGITLTKSSHTKDADGKPLAMAGFPYHALDTYLPKLIRAGERVAICDQLENPKRSTEEIVSSTTEEVADEKKEPKDNSSEDIETLKAEVIALKNQYEEQVKNLREQLKAERKNGLDMVRTIIKETVEAFEDELPPTLTECFYSQVGKLKVIKIKNDMGYSLTADEVSYLIDSVENSQEQSE